jgi:hypothetical protein
MAGTLGTGWQERFMGGSPEAEAALLREVLADIERIQDIVAGRQAAAVHRAFHNKGQALEIEFTVSPDVPPELQLAYLRPGTTYRGFARFSRSQSFHAKDGDLDQRGFAFRIETPAGPQDVLLSNTPVSFARDPIQFLTVARMFVESRKPIAAVRVILAIGLSEGIRVLRNLLGAPDRTVAFTSQPYWSRTPFAFGSSAARLVARPLGPARRVEDRSGDDYLSTDLAAELAAGPRSFELQAIPFLDDARTPIENASHEWPESLATPIPLGRVTLLQQNLASPAAVELEERVERQEAFNPWNTPGLLPLGRTNRSRRVAYGRSARHRGAGMSPLNPAPAAPAAVLTEPAWEPRDNAFDRLTASLAATNHRWVWGMGGAVFAGFFALWLLVLPIPMERFAWTVHPRLAMAFIGAGYIFRTVFFINAATESDWRKLRWIVWGNLAFTGTLLFATFWHASEFHWKLAWDLLTPGVTPFGHIWLILYIFEPGVMLYLFPRGTFALPPTRTGGPIHPLFRAFLIATAMVLLANGLLLVINPDFTDKRWAWTDGVNELDARIMAAWFLGWAVWCGTMARVRDWDEIRTATRLFILTCAALFIALALNGEGFRHDDVHTPSALLGSLALLTIVTAGFHWLQERRRPEWQ